MTDKPENPPAFPCAPLPIHHQGMTLRDYFAGKVMTVSLGDFNKSTEDLHGEFNEAAENIAIHCYTMADYMLTERQKTTKPEEDKND